MDARAEMSATVARITRRVRRSPDVRESLSALWYRLAGTPDRKELLLRRAKIGGPIALVALAIAAWLVFRPIPQPDYDKDSLKKVFNYTLLTDEFNKLPVEKRMELIGQLVNRLKNMSSGDSALMAAFAAGVAGAAREQIEENGSRLAIDLWDKYAALYKDVKPEDRAAFLDKTYIEFVRTMEAIGGAPSKKSDSELIGDVQKQAKRGQERMRSGEERPPAQAMGRMFNFMRSNVGSHATPAQRSRGQLLMRDMVRHFRGEGGG